MRAIVRWFQRNVLWLLAIAILLPVMLVTGMFWNQIGIDPPRFLKEYWEFVGNIATVYIAFYLVHKYWAKRELSRRARILKQTLRGKFLKMAKQLEKMLSGVEREVTESVEPIMAIDQEIQFLVSMFVDVVFEDSVLYGIVMKYKDDLAPLMLPVASELQKVPSLLGDADASNLQKCKEEIETLAEKLKNE